MTGRRAAERRGRLGEWAAALWLQAKGYRILARRARGPLGEIDLVARRGQLLVFVEVKTRPSHTAALEAIAPRQRRRIERAAAGFAAARGLAEAPMRFDAILLAPFRLPRHMRDAWRAGGQ